MAVATIGIDIGTHSTKGVLVTHDGTILRQTTVQHDVSMPHPGWFEHDADGVWWSDTVDVSRQLMADIPRSVDVAAVGISACGPCLVPLDDAGLPLRPGILYGVDTRASAQIATLEDDLGSDAIVALCGMPLTSQSVGPKLLWLRDEEPETYEAASCVLTATGYVVYRLTGEFCVDHHQAGYFAPFYSLDEGCWTTVPSIHGSPEALLPRLVWSDEVAGTVSSLAARLTGLPAGIPVVAGSSDGLNDAIGAGIVSPGDAVIRYGSTMAVVAIATTAKRTGALWITPGAQRSQLNVAAALSASGSVTSWFRRELAQELPQETATEVSDAHQQLVNEARMSPQGAGGLLVLPYFAGERTPFYDPGARGVMIGLTLAHTRGDMYRAVLEGAAFGVRHVLEAMRDAGVEINLLRAVGGGATDDLWMQIVSDVTGETQEIAEPRVGAPYGAAFLAALAVGSVSGLAAAESWVHASRTIRPRPQARADYDRRYRVFRELYTRTRDLLDELRDVQDLPLQSSNGREAT